MDAKLPLWKPYLEPGKHHFTNGANFASAGAGVLPATNPGTLYLEIQLMFFKEVASLLRRQLGDAMAEQLLRNAVYLSSIGVDYASFISNNPDARDSHKQELVKWVIGNITDVVQEIYTMGGRKFAFQNVAPMDCLPSAKQEYNLKANECLEVLTELAILHNKCLLNAIKDLEMRLSDFKFLIFDFYSSLLERINNPLKHGFKEADVACCGSGIYHGADCVIGDYKLCSNPNEYLFFDGSHPTEHGYFQFGTVLWNGEMNVTTPLSMKQLFGIEIEPAGMNILGYSNGQFVD